MNGQFLIKASKSFIVEWHMVHFSDPYTESVI